MMSPKDADAGRGGPAVSAVDVVRRPHNDTATDKPNNCNVVDAVNA